MMAQQDESRIHKLLISAAHPVEESVGGPAASALMHKKTTTLLHPAPLSAVVFPKQQLSTAGEIELEQVVQKAQGYGEVVAAVTTSVVAAAAAESPELPAVSSSLSGELQLIQQPQQHKRDVRGIGFTVMPSVSAMTDDELLQQQDLVMLVQKRSPDESFTLQNGAGASTESSIAAAASPKLMRSTAALDQNGEVRTSAGGGGGGGEQLDHRGKGGLAKKAQARSSALHKEIHNVVLVAHPLPVAITEKPEMEINVQKKEGRGVGLKVTFVDQDLESNCSCSSSPPPATNKALNSARGSGSSSWQQQLRRDDGAGCTTKLLRSPAAAPGASSTPSPRKAAAVSTAMTKHAAADFKQVQQQKKKKQEAHHAGKLMMKAASTVGSSSSSSQQQLHTSGSTRDSLSSPPEIVLDSSTNLATSKYLDSRNQGGDDWEELEEGLKSLNSSSPSFFSGGGGAGASFDTRASSKLLLSSETSSIRLSPNLHNHHRHVAAAAFHMRDKPFILGSDGSQILAALDAQDPDDDDDDDDEGKVAMLCSSMADTNKLSGDLGKLLGTVYGKLRRPSSGSETMVTTTHTKSSRTTTSNHNSISKGDKKKKKSQIASTSSATKSSSVGYGLGAQKFEIGSYTSLKLLQECCSIELKDTTLASKLTGTPRKMRDKLGPHRHYYRGITMRLEQKLKLNKNPFLVPPSSLH
ncbi:unnamed protein product [Sphagnum troendelagicum]|uniref:Uncharacterized protein n=1 Tax=Sphagnum troendelagicum TaxID=128251 RepID=A0ABP0TEV8_9BRYO